MRIGLSWDLDGDMAAPDAWRAVLGEIGTADGFGLDSVWVEETRDGSSCPAPTVFLTYAARRSSSVQLRAFGRTVGRDHPVRIAEEVAVLDLFSRGRAGLGFASAGAQGVDPACLHEHVDFVRSAWASDDFRYRGEFIRFPTHTPDDAPAGSSRLPPGGEYVPQWERGPAMPDHLAVTPKPCATMPPVYVDVADDDTLAWAAREGVSPVVGAGVPTAEAVERLARYLALASEAGRATWASELVLERRIAIDGPGDDRTLGGSPREIVKQIRELAAEAGVSHLVWRRTAAQTGRADQIMRFASEVQLLLQA